MLLDDYYWHYDYARLAWDTGFCFEKYKYPNLDKNKICLIDIDRIIRERDVASVERNISIVVQYVLENDQAIVLDSNFVKLFRLSQLSVEYLLFCKKYLDKTVVLLKKDVTKLKQELKELKQYIEELESHISSSRNVTARYPCETCSKMFSSEDYLNSHVKRRHSTPENKDVQTEAEKLHSEIKELKERLNSTEKFIQEKPSPREVENFKEVSTETEGKTAKLVCEIQESFEKFRNQVEDKMNNLQTEKNFFTDKYDKLFDVVLHYKNKEKEEGDQDSKSVEKPVMEGPRIEDSSTQTEHGKTEKILEIQTFQHDNTYHVAETVVPEKAVEDIDQKLEKKLTNFEESIESKISTGLGNIENQIQAFWQKLSEVDLPNQQVPDVPKIADKHVQPEFSNDSSTQEEVKPMVKPRTKFTITEEKQVKDASAKKQIQEMVTKKQQIQEMVTKKQMQDDVDREAGPKSSLPLKSKPDLQPAVIIKPAAILYESSSDLSGSQDNSLDEELTETREHEDEAKPKPFLSKIDHKLTSVKPQIASGKDLPHKNQKDDALEEIRQQLVNTIDCSLQEMGISPRWNGIPRKTFERALEIVQHQATVSKKSLPQYDSLRKSIEKMLKNNKELKEAAKKVKTIRKEASPHKNKSKPKTIKIQIKKNELPISKPSPVVTIKNPALYDTESETDMKPYLPKSFNQEKNDPGRKSIQEKAHSAVIEELQSKFLLKLAETDSDLNSIDDKDVQKETKSAMKSFPSEGSLVKKKVFFDVENLDGEDEVKATTESGLNTEKKMDDSISDFEIT